VTGDLPGEGRKKLRDVQGVWPWKGKGVWDVNLGERKNRRGGLKVGVSQLEQLRNHKDRIKQQTSLKNEEKNARIGSLIQKS